jgi:lipid-binding SYLF domain-containing protein
MPQFTRRQTLIAAASLAGAMAASQRALAQAATPTQQELVDRARATVDRFRVDPDMGTLNRMLPNAKAVVIVPSLIRAGFLIGAEGGSGVMIGRDQGGNWGYPAFIYMATGSVGLQIGVQDAEVMLVIMTDNGLFQSTTNEFRMGADASVALGPIGSGVEAATTFNFGADIYAFSKARGLFGGAALEGSVMRARTEYNRAYYGQALDSRAIVVNRQGANPGADPLRAALARR